MAMGSAPAGTTYLEDIQGAEPTVPASWTSCASWSTNAAMEGLWQIRIAAKDPSVRCSCRASRRCASASTTRRHPAPRALAQRQAQIEANPPLDDHRRDVQGQPDAGDRVRQVPGGHDHLRKLRGARSGYHLAEPALRRAEPRRDPGWACERRRAEPLERAPTRSCRRPARPEPGRSTRPGWIRAATSSGSMRTTGRTSTAAETRTG